MFTNIRKCRSKLTGKEYAAKFSQRNRCGTDCTADIYHEVALLSIVASCSRVVSLCDVFETRQEIILVLEYAPGGDLQSIIDENMVPFESDVVEFIRSLLEGLVYIHEKHIAHLDIKPQNLVMMGVFPDCNIKLCDFEISRVILPKERIREILGTPDYVAPEILHYEPISTAADMWSLGVTTYVLLTGFTPFGGDTDQETFCNISKAELDFPEELFEDVSDQAKDFISRLLVRNPSTRPTATECLHHPWIAQHTHRSSGPSGRRYLSISAAPSPAASCKDLSILRKHLSKSREALFERVAGSNLRKALSRSRDRLCGSHLSLVARSRDTLYDMPSIAARRRSRDELCTLLSRSHEVLGVRECEGSKLPGSRVDQWPLPAFQILGLGNRNGSLGTGNKTNVAEPSETAGDGEDSGSEGTIKDWKEESWTTAKGDSSSAKICDSDGESDKVRVEESDENMQKGKKVSEGEIKEDTDGVKEEIKEMEKNNANREIKQEIKIEVSQREKGEDIYLPSKEESKENTLLPKEEDERSSESPSPEPEEPRYTVAQLISAFNKRWESQQQPLAGKPPFMPDNVYGVVKLSKVGSCNSNEESGCPGNEKGGTDNTNNKKQASEGEDSVRPISEYLRSGSLSSETSGYETPSDVSSMASWEEGLTKPKSLTQDTEEDGTKSNQLKERRGSAQGLFFHHSWGMKVCDGSYSRAMEKFGNVERSVESKGHNCRPIGEPSLDKSHRKCKSLVKPFL
ncbi:hypothetical protein J437_LFUL011058 [Ladona fulva]|uniref:Protein kinase domain-containing protein n=1 Tax=Ladona fulva TaxID=123851 RepID=A0A8K0KCB0_LADFU|nr:hypothetical protein J437_LFUL011058 [Ladona fulva]